MSHIANGRFSDERRRVREWDRVSVGVLGRPHPSDSRVKLGPDTELNAAEWHVVKHIVKGSWDPTTTTAEYLEDIKAAVMAPSSVLDVGKDEISSGTGTRLASRAAVRTDMNDPGLRTIKAVRDSGFHLFTLYDPVRKKLLSSHRRPTDAVRRAVERWQNHRTFGP